MFRRMACERGQNTAVVCNGQQVSYSELEEWVNGVSAQLRGPRAGDLTSIGLCMDRSIAMVVTALAIMDSGCAYIPLDPTHPPERLAMIVADSGLGLLCCDEKTEALCQSLGVTRLRTDLIRPSSKVPMTLQCHALQPAYIIFTSGSTGRPKGVVVPHRSAACLLSCFAAEPGFGYQDRLLAVTTLSFDISVLEIFLPLTTGGVLVLATNSIAGDGLRLIQELKDQACTLMQATPATWKMMLAAGWLGDPNLTVMCGGETLPPLLAGDLTHSCRSLWNVYGPTETTIWSSRARLEWKDQPHIGKPIQNTAIYILTPGLDLLPMLCIGEIVIGGHGVTTGYWGRPALTAVSFVPDPFSQEPGARLYRTGDLGRNLWDGNMECLGRIDFQVKLRGYRIEPGEIEKKLSDMEGVTSAAVLLREDRTGDQQLVAYLTMADNRDVTLSFLREYLRQHLPEYMIPTALVTLGSMPLTPNGKLDRKALPAPERQINEKEFMPPETAIEKTLAEIWCGVLGLDRVGIHDDFFETGGNSLLATQVMVRVTHTFECTIPLAKIFEKPTIAKLSQLIQNYQWANQTEHLDSDEDREMGEI